MFVSRSMTRKVITVGSGDDDLRSPGADGRKPDPPSAGGRRRQQTRRHRHDRDLRSALPYRYFKEGISPAETESLKNLRVKDIMTQKVITISPAYTIQDALW